MTILDISMVTGFAVDTTDLENVRMMNAVFYGVYHH